MSNLSSALETDFLFVMFKQVGYRFEVFFQTGRWYHLCVASVPGGIAFIVDGSELSTLAESSNWLPLNGSLVLGQEQDSLGGGFTLPQSFIGKISGLQMWMSRKPFENNLGELCKEDLVNPDQEDILAINIFDLNWISFGKVVPYGDDPCKSKNAPEYVVLPRFMILSKASDYCSMFNMHIANIENQEQNDFFTQLLSNGPEKCRGFLTVKKYAWTTNIVSVPDDVKGNVDWYARLHPTFDTANPNCSTEGVCHKQINIVLTSDALWESANATTREACPLCSGYMGLHTYSLIGLCPTESTPILLYPRIRNGQLQFEANIDLVMLFSDEGWMIKQNSDNQTVAVASTKFSQPYGINEWKILMNVQNCLNYDSDYPTILAIESYSKMLVFANCSTNEFICGDGECVPKEERCSRVGICTDLSDEKDCEVIRVNELYNPKILPPDNNMDISLILKKVPLNIC